MNMFAKAQAKAGDNTGKKKAKKQVEAVYFESLDDLAMLKDLIKQLTTVHDTLDAEVKDEMLDEFVSRGRNEGKKPANFPGKGDASEGNMQIRQRSSRSRLTDADIETLDELGISYTETDDTHFYINKEYAGDEKLLSRVSEALEGVKGIPSDFIQATPTTYVTTEDSIDELFANKRLSADRVREVLSIVATPAMRLKYTGDHDDLIGKVADMIGA